MRRLPLRLFALSRVVTPATASTTTTPPSIGAAATFVTSATATAHRQALSICPAPSPLLFSSQALPTATCANTLNSRFRDSQISNMATSSAAAESGPDATNPTTTPGVDAKPIEKKEEAQAAEEKEEPKLPPLSPADFRAYNRLSEHMNYFHEHFRQTWNMLWNAATTGRRPQGMSIRSFINSGLQFVSQLEMHHGIEEAHFFPVLAKKMPEFKTGKGEAAAELLRQHREIHKGMDLLQGYLRQCQSGEADLEMGVLKTKMESWATVLWTHLDQEVKTLGAENMRKYWTLEELRRMPI